MSDKPKHCCPVLGCTTPASIFHDHAGAEPLTNSERAELEAHRYLAAIKDKPKSSFESGTEFHESMDRTREALFGAGHAARPGHQEAQRLLNESYVTIAKLVEADPRPAQSFVRLVGSIAWRLLVALVVVGVTVVLLAGGRA